MKIAFYAVVAFLVLVLLHGLYKRVTRDDEDRRSRSAEPDEPAWLDLFSPSFSRKRGRLKRDDHDSDGPEGRDHDHDSDGPDIDLD